MAPPTLSAIASALLAVAPIALAAARAAARRGAAGVRAFVWCPASPCASIMREGIERALDATLVRCRVSASLDECPADCEVLVLPGSAWPTELDQLEQFAPRVRAVVVPYAGIARAHIERLRAVFGERLGEAVSLHNLHHNAPMTAEMGLALMFVRRRTSEPARHACDSGRRRLCP